MQGDILNANFQAVGTAFVPHYYNSFDGARPSLRGLYRDNSMLTFEGQQFQGTDAIMGKLEGLPFKTVKHVTTTIDCQPTPNNGVIIFVVGQLKTDNDPIHSFSQCFHLRPAPENPASFFIYNDMFRLSLHHG